MNLFFVVFFPSGDAFKKQDRECQSKKPLVSYSFPIMLSINFSEDTYIQTIKHTELSRVVEMNEYHVWLR